VRGHVLIVEDDPDILSSLAEVIREEGFDVETAANGYQALARLESNPPGLIFLDLMMPLMDGWKFMELARQRFPSLAVPIVLLSAVHSLPAEAARLGVTAYLTKPFDLEDVARLAHDLCTFPPSSAARHP
jgi:two-component system, NtrC family, nitrogen regulation response regulator NtrX